MDDQKTAVNDAPRPLCSPERCAVAVPRSRAAVLLLSVALLAAAGVSARAGAAEEFGCLPPYEEPERTLGPDLTPYVEQGPEHRALDFLVGCWRIRGTLSSAPGEEPRSISGRMETRWIHGGRWLESRAQFDLGGTPARIFRILGYDSVERSYFFLDLDNWRTFPSVGTGRMDDGGATLTITYLSRSPFGPSRPIVVTLKRNEEGDGYRTTTSEVLPDGSLDLRSRAVYERVEEGEPGATCTSGSS